MITVWVVTSSEITCPVDDCITMDERSKGQPYMNWMQDERNPHREEV
ncbi:hypothetical protein [Psychromonas sp. KJ10-2]